MSTISVEGCSKEDMVRDKKRKTKKNGHLAQKNADLKSSSVAIGDLNAVEEGAESLLVSLQCKLRKSEKKNRKLRIENERNVHEILLFNHQHYLELENENIDLVRRCSEMKELLRCELKLEYGDKVQVLPSFAFDENKMIGDHGTVSVPDIERIQLDVIGPADHNIEQDDGIYLTIKSSTIINAKDDDIFIQSTSDIKGNDFTLSVPSQIMDPVSKDAIQSEEDHSYRLNKEVAALETMLENEKRRCDAMISNYENDKTRIIVEAAEIERKNIESFRREEIRLLSIVREKEDQLSKLLENLKAIKQSERVLIDETKNRTLRKSENKIMLDRQRWKHLCAEMSEITVRMCTGALTIPEFQLKSNSTEDDTISTNFMKMVASNDSPDRYNNSRSSSSSGHLINSVSHSLAMQDYLRTSRLSGNVLVKKDYLSTLLLLAKVK